MVDTDPFDAPPSPQGDSPRVVLPDEPAELDPDAPQEVPGPPPSVVRALVGSAGLGIVGAIAWAAVTIITDYQLGLLAIGIGLLAGVGAAYGGKGKKFQVIGASCAAGSYFLGQFLIVIAIVMGQAGAADELPVEPAPTGEQAVLADGPNGAPAAVEPAGSEVGLDADLADTAPGEQPGPEGFFGAMALVLFLIVQETFSSAMSVLFLGLAVYEGWKLPRAE